MSCRTVNCALDEWWRTGITPVKGMAASRTPLADVSDGSPPYGAFGGAGGTFTTRARGEQLLREMNTAPYKEANGIRLVPVCGVTAVGSPRVARALCSERMGRESIT